jgi:hypothetical protein
MVIRKLVSSAAALSLCLGSVTPALAQDYRFAGQDSPHGANATVNFRVPLGPSARQSRPTFGLTFGIGRTMSAGEVDGRTTVRQMRFADFRFSGDGLRQARIAGFDLANPDQSRLFFSAGDNKSVAAIAAAAAAAGLALCIFVLCDDDNNDEDTSSPGTNTPG